MRALILLALFGAADPYDLTDQLAVGDPSAAKANRVTIERAANAAAGKGRRVTLPAGDIYVDSVTLPPKPLWLRGQWQDATALISASGLPALTAGIPAGTFSAADFPDVSAAIGREGHGLRMGRGRWIVAPHSALGVDRFDLRRQFTLEIAGDFGDAGPAQFELVGGARHVNWFYSGRRLGLQVYRDGRTVSTAYTPTFPPLSGVKRLAVAVDLDLATATFFVDGVSLAVVPLPGFGPGVTVLRDDITSWKVGGWQQVDTLQEPGAYSTDVPWTLLGFRVSSGVVAPAADLASLRRLDADPTHLAMLRFDEDIERASVSRQVGWYNGKQAGYALYMDAAGVGDAKNAMGLRVSDLSVVSKQSYGVTFVLGGLWNARFDDLKVSGNAAVGLGGIRYGSTYPLHFTGDTWLEGSHIAMQTWRAMVAAEGLIQVRRMGIAGLYLEQTDTQFRRIEWHVNATPATRWFGCFGGDAVGDVLYTDNEGDATARGPLESLFRFEPRVGAKSATVDIRQVNYAMTPPSVAVVTLGDRDATNIPGRLAIGAITSQSVTSARAMVVVESPAWRGNAGIAWRPNAATPLVLDATPLGWPGVWATDTTGSVVPAVRPAVVVVPR